MKFYLLLFFGFISCSVTPDAKYQDLVELMHSNDIPMPKPQPGDWLYHHKEKGQTFETYSNQNHSEYEPLGTVIYLQPLGNFTAFQLNQIEHISHFISTFYGRKTIILNPISNSIFPERALRKNGEGQTQILAPYILDLVLFKTLPKDALSYMAICEYDLFPKPEWNFVFGLASLSKHVGAVSIHRFLINSFSNQRDSINFYSFTKTLCHELGHTLAIKHCVHARCLMNGANSAYENESKLTRFCSECTGKLIWKLKINPLQRLKLLNHLFSQYSFSKEKDQNMADLSLLESQTNLCLRFK